MISLRCLFYNEIALLVIPIFRRSRSHHLLENIFTPFFRTSAYCNSCSTSNLHYKCRSIWIATSSLNYKVMFYFVVWADVIFFWEGLKSEESVTSCYHGIVYLSINMPNQLTLKYYWTAIGSSMWFCILQKELGAMQWRRDSYQMVQMHANAFIWLVGWGRHQNGLLFLQSCVPSREILEHL